MSFDTYANLQTEILAKINRTDTDAVTRCPSWIKLAEDEIRLSLNRLMVRQGETRKTDYTISSEFTALPDDFYRVRSVVITTSNPKVVLDYATPSQADNWNPYSVTSVPRYWTIQGNQLRVYPSPDASYTATLTYYSLPALSSTNTTNWLLTSHPKIYFKGALVEAYDYYENYDARALAISDREMLLDNLNMADGSDQQGSNMRMRVSGGNP